MRESGKMLLAVIGVIVTLWVIWFLLNAQYGGMCISTASTHLVSCH